MKIKGLILISRTLIPPLQQFSNWSLDHFIRHPSRTHPFAGRTRKRGWRGSGCRPRRSATDAPASAGRASASMETANRRHRAGRRGCRRRPRCPIGRWPGRRCSTPTRRQPASSGAGAAAVGGGAATSTGRKHRRHRSRPGIGPRSATTSTPIWKFERHVSIFSSIWKREREKKRKSIVHLYSPFDRSKKVRGNAWGFFLIFFF